MAAKVTADDKLLGQAIRAIRKEKHLSQPDLGNALNVTFQQIQKYERGENSLRAYMVPALCKALKITANSLFAKVEEIKRSTQTEAVR